MIDLEGQPLKPGDEGLVRVRIRQLCDGNRGEVEVNHLDRDGEVNGSPVIVPGRVIKKAPE